jgi:hypothetical protein|tara:strand:+ start:680 stop:1135 length:456 start_codon:yes stop_codon:yes gene_type:complete
MASRIFRYADADNAGTGETNGGGASSQFLVYQTATATPPASIVGGTSVGSVMGPDEASVCIVAYANSAVNSSGANGVTYDVEFYGSDTAGQQQQIDVMNAAVFQANADGVDIAELDAYPYGGGDSVDFAAAQINNANGVPITVIINGTVTV